MLRRKRKAQILAHLQIGNVESNTTLVFIHGSTMTKELMVLVAEKIKLRNKKTTCYAGVFSDSFSFKQKNTFAIISVGSPTALRSKGMGR